MSKLITTSKLNRLWKNGILPIKQSVDNHKTETNKAISDINTALEVMDEKVDGVVESGLGSKIVCTCTGDNAVGTVLTGTLNGESYRATIGSDGKATFMISDCGKFVITGTEDYKFKAVTVDVLYFGIYYVSIKAVAFDYTEWLTAAGLSASSYADLDAVLADEKAVRTLMTKTASVDYMVTGLSDNAEVAEQILANDYVAKWVNYREHAYSSLGAVASIKSVMDSVGKYGCYWTCAKTPLVPTLTSNAGSDGGEVIRSGDYSTNYGWKAFDGSDTTWWTDPNANTGYIGYKFPNSTCVKSFSIKDKQSRISKYILQASNDNSVWDTLYTSTVKTGNIDEVISINNDKSYLYYRINITSTQTLGQAASVTSLQFYGTEKWEPKGLVPIMTSNTAPYGECSADSVIQSGYEAYRVFDSVTTNRWTSNQKTSNSWFQYKFTIPTCVKRFYLQATTEEGVRIKNYKIQASNNGTDYVDLYTGMVDSAGSPENRIINNTNYYLYYRVFVIDNYTNSIAIKSLQFYGRQLEALVPTMTSNTAPVGEAICSGSSNSKYMPFHVFRGTYSTSDDGLYWEAPSASKDPNPWIGYDFGKPVIVNAHMQRSSYSANSRPMITARIDASNDKTEWITIKDNITVNNATKNAITVSSFENTTAYRYWRVYQIEGGDSAGSLLTQLQFYGAPDYDSRTYIYDHGIELMDLVAYKNNNSYVAEKQADRLYMKKNGGGSAAFTTVNKIDMTDYSLMKATLDTDILDPGTNHIANSDISPWVYAHSMSAGGGYKLIKSYDGAYLDQTNVNKEAYALLLVESQGSFNATLSVNEWWLE